MHYFSGLFAFVFLLFGPIHGNNWETCGDWIQYNDEKCFKIIDDTLRTFDEAKNVCAEQEHISTLPVIRSSEEQQFLSNYLFKTEQKVENFWIGAKYSSQKDSFIWIDDYPLNYTNWDAGHSPQNLADYCIHMQADTRFTGKWRDGRCVKKNAVVCQRMQFWSTEFLQKKFLDSRMQLRNSLDIIQNLTQSLANANKKFSSQKENLQNVNQRIDVLMQGLESANARINEQSQCSIPIGFLYTQLPNEKDPFQIWPSMVYHIWTDVSSQFAGVFFRVSGGEAASFGYVQDENSPQLSTVEYKFADGKLKNNLAPGLCPAVRSGGNGGELRSLEFCMSSGEIRPRNMAVRIWKRTG